uniref:SAND domain-containing protein n=1 Tax=Periophthalmus magnuspinnatus TaxID=409849 RepID=A0A3B4BHC1_9GOBI
IKLVKTVCVVRFLLTMCFIPSSEEMPMGTPEEAQADTSAADSLSKEAVIVKLSEEVDTEADVFYSITCGDAKATLVWKKFVCPGINVKCVQFNSQLISPKEFVCLAGKSTLKDWKRAIRLNGTMLRKIMDSGELDFYQHSKVCSNTCRSTKIDLVGAKVSLSVDGASELLPTTPAADLNGMALSFSESTDEASEWVTAIGEDSVAFWKAVKEAGMLDEVVLDFEKELQDILKGLEERANDPPLQVKGQTTLTKALGLHSSLLGFSSLFPLSCACEQLRTADKVSAPMECTGTHEDFVDFVASLFTLPVWISLGL